MLELYHAPLSRASLIVQLIEELGATDKITLHEVSVVRPSGEGEVDPANPHPDGKVPYLVHDGIGMTETNAIALYLTELFPEAELGYPVGDPRRAQFLSWLAWYGNVLEPVMHFHFLQLNSPGLHRTYRDFPTAIARFEAQLSKTPFLTGDRYTAADLICAAPFYLFPALMPAEGPVKDWLERSWARPAAHHAAEAFKADWSNSLI